MPLVNLDRTAAAAALGLLLLAGASPPANAADTVVGVSSDGREFRGKASDRRVVPSFEGLASAAPTAPADDALADLKATPESAEDVWRLWQLTPAVAPIGRESIIGPDERKRVANTRAFPYRAVALVTFEGSRCTGWLIGNDTVATAGHCVHTGGPRGRWYRTASYRIYPGRDGGARPYGACTAKTLYSNTAWINRSDSNYDYGAIKLNCTIGARTGTFGYYWTQASLTGVEVEISGYPGDKPLTQWRSTGPIEISRPHELFYANDTLGGQSGAPVFSQRSGCGICSAAVHAYGTYGRHPYDSFNHGVRITKTVFQHFQQWAAD